MNKHKKTILIVVGVLVLLIFLGAAVLLYLKYVEFEKSRGALNNTLAEQQRLFNRIPFPSLDNITQENENFDLIKLTFAELVGAVRFGQIEPVQQSPAALNAQFWKVQKELSDLAKERGVRLPQDFDFGFRNLMSGSPAPHPDVPRLTQQLLIVGDLTRLLYDSRIVALRSVFREEFEGTIGAPGAPGGNVPAIRPLNVRGGGAQPVSGPVSANPVVKDAGIIPEGGLYGRMHFTLRFEARESSLPEILNRLASDQMFIVVTRLEIGGGVTSVSKPPAAATATPLAGGAPTQPAKMLTRDERLVCGTRETIVIATIDVDVFRFRPTDEIIKQ